jgi:hypothetical protein
MTMTISTPPVYAFSTLNSCHQNPRLAMTQTNRPEFDSARDPAHEYAKISVSQPDDHVNITLSLSLTQRLIISIVFQSIAGRGIETIALRQNRTETLLESRRCRRQRSRTLQSSRCSTRIRQSREIGSSILVDCLNIDCDILQFKRDAVAL